MFEEFRDQTSSSPFFQEDEEPSFGTSTPDEAPLMKRKSLLGLSPRQGFLLSVMFLFEVVILGLMLLIVTGKVVF